MPQLDAKGVAFYDGKGMTPAEAEARCFYNAIENGIKPITLPEQALVVSEILEGIYVSAKTGKPYYFGEEK